MQNQRGVGKSAKKWDRTGTIVEDKGYDKYSVRIDGSGRISDRNRRYLRFFKPDSPTMRWRCLSNQLRSLWMASVVLIMARPRSRTS